MPIISDFYGIVIRMYFKDNEQHKLPHLYASYSEYRVIFDLKENILKGNFPNSKTKIVQAWIEIHNEELNKLWRLLIEGKKGFKIDPLR